MDPPIPENYIIGNVSCDGDSFFSSVAQCLEQVIRRKFSEKILRKVCKKYAEQYTTAFQNVHDYRVKIEYCEDECQSAIKGQPEVEGQMICKHFKVKIHVIKKQGFEDANIKLTNAHDRLVWLHHIVDESGYRPIEQVDYEVAETIYIIQDVDSTFKPIIKNKQIGDDQEGESVTYKIREGTSGVSGHLYEIKLLMLFLLRLQTTEEFYLASNMANVGAFDDIVFKYQSNDKDGIPRSKTIFLQAKHNDKAERGCITLDSLLSPKGAFALLKYFESYLEIKKAFKLSCDPIFKGKFDDCSFMIFTNYVLDETLSKEYGRWLNKKADGIVISDGKHSKQLNISADVNRDMITKLCYSPLHKLAQEMYDYTLGEKKHVGIKIQNKIFEEYHIFLANEIFKVAQGDPQKSSFRCNFFEVETLWKEFYQIAKLSGNTEENLFKASLLKEKINLFKSFGNFQLKLEKSKLDKLADELARIIQTSITNTIRIDDPPQNITQLANNVLVIDKVLDSGNEQVKFFNGELTELAGKFLEKLKAILEKDKTDLDITQIRFEIRGFPRFSLPITRVDDDIMENEVKEFLGKFEIVCGQESENDLDAVIKDTIKSACTVNDEESNAIFQFIRTHVETWWKSGKSHNHFLTNETKFVKNALASISYFYLSAWDKLNSRGIQIAGVKFNETGIRESKGFVDKKQVHNIVAEKGTTLLSSVKVCQALDQEFGKSSYIFTDINHLLNIQDLVLWVFRNNETQKFLLIESNNDFLTQGKWAKKDVEELYDDLLQIADKELSKIIILITENDDMLAQKFEKNIAPENFHKTHDRINFNDLIVDSQEKLLEVEVNLQGKTIKLKELINIEHKDANNAITAKILHSIITNNDNMIISKEPMKLSDLEAAYTKLYEEMPLQNLVLKLLSSSGKNTLFVISGINRTSKSTLGEDLMYNLNITNENEISDLMKKIGTLHDGKDDKTIFIIPNDSETDPLKEFKNFCSVNREKLIYLIELISQHFQLQQVYDPNFYITRRFACKENMYLNLKIILSQAPSTAFILCNADREKIISILNDSRLTNLQHFTEKCGNGTIVFAKSESDAENHFRELKSSRKHVHCLKLGDQDNEHFIWVKSHGSLELLHDFVSNSRSENEQKLYTEDQFRKAIKHKVVIIADEPGMGKTTSLTSISQQMQHENWVIRINFLDCEDEIETLKISDPQILSVDDVYKFILNAANAGLKNDLTKFLIVQKLDHIEDQLWPILILLDGFDEISKHQQRTIIPLLQFITHKTSAKLWVTTRPHMKDVLENNLSVFATEFEALVLDKQKEFLNRFWRLRLGPLLKHGNIECNIDLYSSRLLKKVADILGDNISRIMGVPLQLRLLAEGFRHDVLTGINGNLIPSFDTLDVLNLYRRFVEEKYDIYMKEKIRLHKTAPTIIKILVRGFHKHHKRSALHLLFPDYAAVLDPKRHTKEAEYDMKSVGIIQSIGREGKPYFIHRTFAEYFTAELLASYLAKKEVNPKKYDWTIQFLVKHIFEANNHVIRNFMDRMLSEGSPIHFAALDNKLNEVNELSNVNGYTTVDNLGRMALHLATRDGYLDIVKVLLDGGCHNVPPDALGKTPLHYAAMNGHEDIVEHLLNYITDIDTSDNVFAKPLHANAVIGDSVFNDEQQLNSKLVTFVNQKDIVDKTAFNYVTENSNWVIASSLIFNGANIKFSNEETKKDFISHIIDQTTWHTLRPLQTEQRSILPILCLLLLNDPISVTYNNRNRAWVGILGALIKLGHMKVVEAIVGNMESTERFQVLLSSANYVSSAQSIPDKDNLEVAKYLLGEIKITSLISEFGNSAAKHGNLETLRYILEQGQENDFNAYMFEAIKWGQLSIVEYLFQNNSSNLTDYKGDTALHSAAKYDRLGIVKHLLKNGADVTARNAQGTTPMQYAAVYNSTIVIPYFLKNGVVTLTEKYSSLFWNKLSNCCCKGTISTNEVVNTVEDYVETCITFYRVKSMQNDVMGNLNHIAEVCANTAELTNYEQVVNIIVSQVQHDVNFCNEHGTLLHIAASFQTNSLAKYLIAHGADVNIKDREGRTPLHKAVQTCCQGGKNDKAIIYLLERGAIYDEKDASNLTVLDYFAPSSSDPIFTLLNSIDTIFANFTEKSEGFVDFKKSYAGAICGARNSDGNRVYHLVAESVQRSIDLLSYNQCRTYARSNLKCNSSNKQGNTPLHLAAISGNVKNVRSLIQYGCPYNSCNNQNLSPVQLAQNNSHVNVVEVIMSVENAFTAIKESKKPEIELRIYEEFSNAADENGKTMIHWAAENGHPDIVELLINHKADIEDNDNRGWTPLHYAANNDQVAAIETLLRHCAIVNPRNNEGKTPHHIATGKSVDFLGAINKMYDVIQFENSEIANDCFKSIQKDNCEAFTVAIHSCDNFGNTLLHYAVAANYVQLVQCLLQNGAPYDVQNNSKNPPLQYASDNEIRNMLQLIEQLFKWDSRLVYSHKAIEKCPHKLQLIKNCRDRQGNTILHKAADYPVNYYRLKFLVKNGADINAINKENSTVLDEAIMQGKLDLVKFLLKENVNVKNTAPDSKLRLLETFVKERPDIVDIFTSLENS